MDILVKTSDLARELALLTSIARRNKNTIPVLGNVALSTANGSVELTASDLELGATSTCPAKITKPGSTTLPARRLLDYVKLLPDSDVRIVSDDAHWASLQCGRSKSKLAGLSRETFPDTPTAPIAYAHITAGGIISMIDQTLYAISAEESRFTLVGALLTAEDGMLQMAATDGHRLAISKRPATVNRSSRVIVPRNALNELRSMAGAVEDDTAVECGADDNHLFFQIADRVLFARGLSGTFPDISRVLPSSHLYRCEVVREELATAIKRTKTFADDKSHALKLDFKLNELALLASTDSGECQESISTTCRHSLNLSTGFNLLYLLDFLHSTNTNKVAMLLNEAAAAMEMRPVTGDDPDKDDLSYRYVVMPMRI